MTASMHRVLAALNMPTRAAALLQFATAVVKSTAKSSWFKSPKPPLAKVQAAIDNLAKALVDAQRHTQPIAAPQTAAKKKLVQLLHQVKSYVQEVADSNAEHAAEIIESAGFSVVKRKLPSKPLLAVKRGRVSGMVLLIVKAVGKVVIYEFQMSDDGGKTWIKLSSKLEAQTEVPGLVVGATYWFRFRAQTRRWGQGWSAPVSYVAQ